MRTSFAVCTVIATSLLATIPVWGHHSFAAEFDANKPLKLRGTVTKMDWVNPHAWVHLDVRNSDGTVTNWMVEGGSPNALLRRGFTKNSLPPGTEVMVNAFQAKDGTNRANGQSLTLPDGKKLFLASSAENSDENKQEK